MYKIIATAGEEDLEKLEIYDTSQIDILEVRLDLCSKKYIKEKLIDTLKKWNRSLLFTYRSKEDSSEKKHTLIKYEYIAFILDFFNLKTNYIDLDITKEDALLKNIKDSSYSTIYSYHDFSGYPSEEKMKSFIESIQSKNPHPSTIFKFAVMPPSIEGDIKFLEAGKNLSSKFNMILIIMGERGMHTRLYGDLYGSYYTYSCLDEPRAPGQIKSKDIRLLRKLANLET
jgi:3-dehydroquinate dehydratase I